MMKYLPVVILLSFILVVSGCVAGSGDGNKSASVDVKAGTKLDVTTTVIKAEKFDCSTLINAHPNTNQFLDKRVIDDSPWYGRVECLGESDKITTNLYLLESPEKAREYADIWFNEYAKGWEDYDRTWGSFSYSWGGKTDKSAYFLTLGHRYDTLLYGPDPQYWPDAFNAIYLDVVGNCLVFVQDSYWYDQYYTTGWEDRGIDKAASTTEDIPKSQILNHINNKIAPVFDQLLKSAKGNQDFLSICGAN